MVMQLRSYIKNLKAVKFLEIDKGQLILLKNSSCYRNQRDFVTSDSPIIFFVFQNDLATYSFHINIKCRSIFEEWCTERLNHYKLYDVPGKKLNFFNLAKVSPISILNRGTVSKEQLEEEGFDKCSITKILGINLADKVAFIAGLFSSSLTNLIRDKGGKDWKTIDSGLKVLVIKECARAYGRYSSLKFYAAKLANRSSTPPLAKAPSRISDISHRVKNDWLEKKSLSSSVEATNVHAEYGNKRKRKGSDVM